MCVYLSKDVRRYLEAGGYGSEGPSYGIERNAAVSARLDGDHERDRSMRYSERQSDLSQRSTPAHESWKYVSVTIYKSGHHGTDAYSPSAFLRYGHRACYRSGPWMYSAMECLAGRRHGAWTAADLTDLWRCAQDHELKAHLEYSLTVAQGARWLLWSGAKLGRGVRSRRYRHGLRAEPCFPSKPRR